ncbi:MAG TPA: hypothetical protein VIJ07_02080, partial [Dermatophilaceae bacterium]
MILGLLSGTAVRRFYVLDGDIPVVRGLRETVPVMDFSVRLWSPGWPLDLFAIVGGLSRGHGDPTFRREPDGTIWRGIRTPQGASTLRLRLVEGSAVEAAAWGPGADWVLESVPAMLGDLDDPTGFVAHHPQVAEAASRFSGWRVSRTGLVLEALIPSIIAQKVTGQEAGGSYRTLVHRYGERAPGEGSARGLWVAPSASAWAR